MSASPENNKSCICKAHDVFITGYCLNAKCTNSWQKTITEPHKIKNHCPVHKPVGVCGDADNSRVCNDCLSKGWRPMAGHQGSPRADMGQGRVIEALQSLWSDGGVDYKIEDMWEDHKDVLPAHLRDVPKEDIARCLGEAVHRLKIPGDEPKKTR